jgi:hypothetical protein
MPLSKRMAFARKASRLGFDARGHLVEEILLAAKFFNSSSFSVVLVLAHLPRCHKSTCGKAKISPHVQYFGGERVAVAIP